MSTEVNLGRDVEIARLEWEVCQTATARRELEHQLFPLGAPKSSDSELNRRFVAEQEACDALIAARKKIEAEVLYPDAPPS